MPDGKALQMGTSHLLSQTFAHAFDMKFQNKEGEVAYPWLTSWAVTTRLIGALVMTHGDQKGLVLPPKIAPIQVVIIPIFRKGSDNEQLRAACKKIEQELKDQHVSVKIDDDEHESAGAKFYRWELKGVPVRIEIGPRDLEQKQAMLVERLGLTKTPVSLEHVAPETVRALNMLQNKLFERAKQRRDSLIKPGTKLSEFGPELAEGGFAYVVGWCQQPSCEQLLKECKATIRCLLDTATQPECFNCTLPSKGDVLVAKAY